MLFEVKNTMDAEQVDLHHYVVEGVSQKGKDGSAKVLGIGMGALLLVMNGMQVFSGNLSVSVVLALIMGVVLLVFGIKHKTIFTMITLRRMRNEGMDRVTLTFSDKTFTQRDVAGRSASWKYKDILAIRECKANLYLFLASNWAVMVPAKHFTVGTYTEFREFIMKKTDLNIDVINLEK